MKRWNSWWNRVKRAMAHADAVTRGEVTRPRTEQRRELTDAEKWQQEHGFSAAVTPMPATADISKHNAVIDREYRDEIERRQALMRHGAYRPRFALATYDPFGALTVDQVDWDLEMTADPLRRLDLTHETATQQPMPDEVDLATAREIGTLAREVAALERDDVLAGVRLITGSREELLKAVGGDEALADQLEAKARLFVEDVRGDSRLVP